MNLSINENTNELLQISFNLKNSIKNISKQLAEIEEVGSSDNDEKVDKLTSEFKSLFNFKGSLVELNLSNCNLSDFMMGLLFDCDFSDLEKLDISNNPKLSHLTISSINIYNLTKKFSCLKISPDFMQQKGIDFIGLFDTFKSLNEIYFLNVLSDEKYNLKSFESLKNLKKIVSPKFLKLDNVPQWVKVETISI